MRYLNVERVDQLAEDVFELFLVKDDMQFKVGNCISIYGPDGKTSRPYSFASGVNDPFFSFIIKRFKDGYVSTYLTTLKQGDQVKLSNPFGWFDPGSRPNSVFISTGTGIAPFISSIRSKMNPALIHYHGCRYLSDVIPQINLSKNIHLCFSKEEIDSKQPKTLDGKSFIHGKSRVTDRLAFDLNHRVFIKTNDHHFYLCGLDSMIQDCIHILTQHGIDLDRIHHETFFTSET